MSKKTPAGEYLAISGQAAKAAAEAVTAADKAAQAGDVDAAQAAAKDAADQATICEQAWEALEAYRKGRATEAIGKAKRNMDAAADNARLAKDFVKTARRIKKENEKAAPAVFDQMADAPAEETPEVIAEPEALEGEILEPAHVTAPGMPPALDLAGTAIPDASAAFPWPIEARGMTLDVSRTGFAEIDTEAVQLDYVAEAQKNAEAAELHANSAKSYAEDGNASGARTSAMLAHAAANRARNFAAAVPSTPSEDGYSSEAAEDAAGYAEMAAEYAAAAKAHRQTAEDVEMSRRVVPDPVLAEALDEIDAEAPQAAVQAPEAAEDVPEDAEAVQDAQAAAEDMARAARLVDAARDDLGMPPLPPLPEDWRRPAGVHAERIGPRHTFRQLRPEPKSKPVQTAADLDRPAVLTAADADAWEAQAEAITAEALDGPELAEGWAEAVAAGPAHVEDWEDAHAAPEDLAGAKLGEQGTLWQDAAETVERLAAAAAQAAAEAQHWAGRGRLADAILRADKAAEAARLATLTAADHEPDAGALEVHARRARAWAKAAEKAVENAAG